MWRAYLADGRVVDHDGDNSPSQFLDEIVRFDIIGPNGAQLASLRPRASQRVIFRWTRGVRGADRFTLGVKVGLFDRESGALDVRFFDGREWTATDDVQLLPYEVA